FQLAQRSVTVTSGEQRVVKVTLGPPPVDKELAAPRAFIIPAGGLGGVDQLTPVSWQPKWAASGVMARVRGRGEIVYPPAREFSYALELDLMVRGGRGNFSITVGDLHDSNIWIPFDIGM